MKKSWRIHIGVGLLVANFAGYGLAALVPFMGLSAAGAAAWVGIIILLAELAFLAAVFVLGKPFLEMLKVKLKAWFRRASAPPPSAERPAPVSRARHTTGVAMLIASGLPYVGAELMLILNYCEPGHIRVIIGLLLASDALFIGSLFVLGGLFWERLVRLFQWQGCPEALRIAD